MNRGKPTSLAPWRAGKASPAVALIDPSEFRRSCVSAALSSEGFSVLGSFKSADLVDPRAPYDLVIFISEAGEDDYLVVEEQICWISDSIPELRIAILLDDPFKFLKQNDTCARMVAAVLDVDIDIEVLCVLLRVVHQGYRVLPAITAPSIMRMEAEGVEMPGLAWRDGHPLLGQVTPRQREVLSALFAGYSNKQIAQHLAISESTVKTHIYDLMRRVGAANRTQIVLKIALAGGVLGEMAGWP